MYVRASYHQTSGAALEAQNTGSFRRVHLFSVDQESSSRRKQSSRHQNEEIVVVNDRDSESYADREPDPTRNRADATRFWECSPVLRRLVVLAIEQAQARFPIVKNTSKLLEDRKRPGQAKVET